MIDVLLAVAAVSAILFIVPVIFYGAASRYITLPSPEAAGVGRFLLGVLITKIGTAVAFVMLFHLTHNVWAERWLLFVALWFVMFAASEIGDMLSGRSTTAEALIGILSEMVYVPLATWTVLRLLN